MVQQADSILTAETALEAAEQQQVQKQHGSQLTPKQVLSWLPKNATPAPVSYTHLTLPTKA